MLNLVISISNNKLNCTYITNKGQFKSYSSDIPNNLVEDTFIIDNNGFSDYLNTSLLDFIGKNYKKYQVTFLTQPTDSYSNIIQVQNNIEHDQDYDQLIDKVKHELEGVDINELYYSFKKIAPFLRHFVGIKKSLIDSLLEVSLNLKLSVKAVIPWSLLLPKYSNAYDPSLFIVSEPDKTVFLLSQFNNIYFSKIYNSKFSAKQLSSHIHEITSHDRTSVIKKIFYLGKEILHVDDSLDLTVITIPNSSVQEAHGYELHLLTHFMLDFDKDITTTNINNLNQLPLPVVSKKAPVTVYAGAVVTILLLILGVYFAGNNLNKNNSQLASNTDQSSQQQIAGASTTEGSQDSQQNNNSENAENIGNSSDTDNLNETALQNNDTNQNNQDNNSTQEVDDTQIKRDDLTVNIQNGAGIVGLAGRTMNILKELGYNIHDIGDADLIGLEQTRIRFKKDKINYQELLKTDLENRFLDIVIEDDLDENAEYDVLLILGSKVDEE